MCDNTVTLDASALANLDMLAGAASRGPWECREADGLAAILTQDGWLDSCSAAQDVANARFMAGANPAVVRTLVAIAQRAAKLEAANKPWTCVKDAIPERMPDGRQFSREVLVCDRSRNTPPRMSRVHYYDNHPPVWEGGDPTHWRELPDLPTDDEHSALAAAPAAACPMQAFLEKLDSSDPAVRADAEAHAQRVADELSRTMPAASAPALAAEPIRVPGGQFDEVGAVYLERVNQDYHATLNDDLVVDGEKLYRFVAHPRCSSCHSEGFAPSVTGAGCTFCDGTEGGATPQPAGLGQPGDGLDADDITNLRDALTWMGEATYESHEECGIYRYRLIRRLIAANLFARDYAYAKSTEGHTPASPVKDHDIREAVNQLREVAVRFHHTQQLRSRIQDIVLPLMARATATRNN